MMNKSLFSPPFSSYYMNWGQNPSIIKKKRLPYCSNQLGNSECFGSSVPGKGTKIKYIFHIINHSITVITGGQVGRLITMTENMKKVLLLYPLYTGGRWGTESLSNLVYGEDSVRWCTHTDSRTPNVPSVQFSHSVVSSSLWPHGL